MRYVGYLILLCGLAAGLFFAALNADSVSISFYYGTLETQLSLALVFATMIGVIVGVLGSIGMLLRMRGKLSKMQKSIKMMEKELLNLRSIPIKE